MNTHLLIDLVLGGLIGWFAPDAQRALEEKFDPFSFVDLVEKPKRSTKGIADAIYPKEAQT